jgi:hypothetical protein
LTATFDNVFAVINAMMELKNESVITDVGTYSDTGALTDEEHNAMHSTIPNSDVTFPHSFMFTPIHKVPGDYNSKIVAYVGGGFAWDFALRFVLPDNIEGIVVEIRNSWNQFYAFELMGHDAFYLGNNATHEPKYESMEVIRDLSPSTHPNITTVTGNCRYTLVRTSQSLT